MKGLEMLVEKTRLLPVVALLACTEPEEDTVTKDTDTDTSYTNDTGDTEPQPTYEAPYITSPTAATAYVGEEFPPYTLTAWQDTTGGDLRCSFNAPIDIQVNGCTFTYTPNSSDFNMGPSYPIDMEVNDENGEDEATLTLTLAEASGDNVSLRGLSDLSGYTNETLSGSGTYTGDVTSATMTLDSTLEEVVRSVTVNYSNNELNYELTFNSNIDWSTHSNGYVNGSGTVTLCDYNNACASESVDVEGYAPTEILVTAQTADDKDPLSSATIYVDCNSGESYTLAPNSNGEATAYLNTSEDVCMITSDAGSAYAVYSWEHELDAGSNDLVSDGYYEVWAEVYDNFTPSDLESEYGESSCYSGRLGSSSRDLLMYAGNMLDIVDGTDYGDRDFQRYSEEELSDTIKYWVSETNLNDGSTTDADLYADMYDVVSDGLGRINDENPLGYTFFEEASVIDDANVVFYWGTSGSTNTDCGYNSSDVIETYATGEYCEIELRTASERTVMEESLDTLTAVDLCGDSITSGGNSFTTIDWFVWNTVHFAKYQNLMERTY